MGREEVDDEDDDWALCFSPYTMNYVWESQWCIEYRAVAAF